MLHKILVAAAFVFSASAFADECATRVVTDKIYDSQGASIVSEKSRTSCGTGSNLTALVGIDERCYYFDTVGGRQLACQFPNGQWIAYGDVPVEAIDAFGVGEAEPQSGNYSTRQDYYTGTPSMVGFITNFSKWMSGSLDSESSVLHKKAMYFAAQYSKNGELVTWTNKKQTEMGRIKVVSTIPVQGGICRRMLIELTVGNSSRNLTETACYNISTNKWNFII